MDEDIVSTSGEIPEKFIRELHGLTTHVKILGILAVRCVGINMDYTMSISLLVLKKLAADFDGDTLNILFLLNQEFITMAEEILSPRQMFISRNDGMCDSDLIHSRDTIINANAMKNIYEYTPEEIAQIKALQAME